MKVKLSQDCDRCWKSEKIMGQHICAKDRDEGCPMMDIYKQEVEGG